MKLWFESGSEVGWILNMKDKFSLLTRSLHMQNMVPNKNDSIIITQMETRNWYV